MSVPVISVWVPRALGVAILGALLFAGGLALRDEAESDGLVARSTLDFTLGLMWVGGSATVAALFVTAVGLLRAKRP